MAKKKTNRPDANPVVPVAPMLMECGHCGTVERALTVWPADVVAGCGCVCHVRKAEHNVEAARIAARRQARGIA